MRPCRRHEAHDDFYDKTTRVASPRSQRSRRAAPGRVRDSIRRKRRFLARSCASKRTDVARLTTRARHRVTHGPVNTSVPAKRPAEANLNFTVIEPLMARSALRGLRAYGVIRQACPTLLRHFKKNAWVVFTNESPSSTVPQPDTFENLPGSCSLYRRK